MDFKKKKNDYGNATTFFELVYWDLIGMNWPSTYMKHVFLVELLYPRWINVDVTNHKPYKQPSLNDTY